MTFLDCEVGRSRRQSFRTESWHTGREGHRTKTYEFRDEEGLVRVALGFGILLRVV